MASFIHLEYPNEHPGVARFERVVDVARSGASSFDGTKGLAALLLGAVVAAVVVIADQLVDSWADGHLMAAWVMLWAITFAVIGLMVGTSRRAAHRLIAAGNAWAARSAARRADARLWEVARSDPRVMADLMTALAREPQTAETLTDKNRDPLRYAPGFAPYY